MRKKIITVAATLLLLGLRGDGENAGDSLSVGAE